MVDSSQIGKIVCLLTLLIGITSHAQTTPLTDRSETPFRMMFYNVENLFHPTNDPEKNDDEFTKEGTRYWSFNRYYDKLNKIAKTAIAVGGWEPPALIGLCEVENIQCVKDLVKRSPLKKFGYEIVFKESADKRGIDVALIYRPEKFELISTDAIELIFPEDHRPTRDILYVKGIAKTDTIHAFVNHWPSRYGGQLASLPKRNFAAQTLKNQFDSILQITPTAKIIAMGDFNDHPDDESMADILKAKKTRDGLKEGDLLNLTWQYEFKKGTHKYDHEWGILDQFIISQPLLDSTGAIFTQISAMQIFDAPYLLEPEKDGVGKITNRTYIGFKYHGGYSDHLPIYMDLFFNP